jgi:acetyl esterase/lipase
VPGRDPREILSRPAPPPDAVLRYGPGPEHVADVRFPGWWRSAGGAPDGPGRDGGAVPAAPVALVLLLHGGFWRAGYDRSHTGPLAHALAAENFVVCAPEYRRTGMPGGGWPGTLDDVAAAVDVLPRLVRTAAADARPGAVRVAAGEPGEWRVVLAGHSAGGHLALWAAGRHRLPAGSPWRSGGLVPGLRGVVALAPVSDLAGCWRAGLGGDAAGALLGGGPGEWPGRYAAADPSGLLPLGCPVRIVHGSADEAVPCGMSRDFVRRAGTVGDDVVLAELPGRGHFEVIDPGSDAWPEVLGAFRGVGYRHGWPDG